MKIRTFIVDDEPLARDRLRQLLQNEADIEIIGEYANGHDAVAAIQENAAGPPLSGHPDARTRRLRRARSPGRGPLPVIVFVTAFDRFAVKAFEVHAVDYLLKPFDRERFQKALHRAIEQVRNRDAAVQQRQSAVLAELPPSKITDRVAVKSGGHVVWVKLEEIDWIGSADNYAELHVGAKSHLLRETLGALETRLPPEKFVRISRSAIVNAQRIKELHRLFYGGCELVLQNGTRLTLSRRYRDKLQQLGVK